MDYEKLGDNIRNYREQRGFTQEKLAELSNISEKHLSKIERGLLQPSLDELIRLAQRINTTASHLLKQVEAAESQKHVSHASKNKFL